MSRRDSAREVGMAGAKGLGRGLDVLLKGIAVDREHPEVMLLKISQIRPNPRQPRLEFDPAALEDLSNSIKSQGVIQPILVRPGTTGAQGYELVAGERRLRASSMAGLDEIPAIVREVTDEQSLALALIENLQRENLNALEEAKGLQQLLGAYGLSQESLAERVGKSRSAVANSLRLLQLPQAIQDSLFKDQISAGHARALLSVQDEALREALWKLVVARASSVRETEEFAAYIKEHGALPEGELVPETPQRPARARAPKGEAVKDLERKLGAHFPGSVKMSGSLNKGKITFSFASEDELRSILNQWGLPDA